MTVGCNNHSPGGLAELVDNNPYVCADEVWVPDAAATLALVALGPLIRAGLLLEDPAVQLSFPCDTECLECCLRLEGWTGSAAVVTSPQDFGTVLVANAIAEIPSVGDWTEIDQLFDECYGREFFVSASPETWDTSLVQDQPFAAYDLRVSPGDDRSILTVRVMADKDGKCGAAQMVHTMNVMCGFEETLGLEGKIR